MRPALVLFAAAAGCTFAPDLSRFPPCGDGGACPPGASCLVEANRCVPTCELGCALPDAGTDGGDLAGPDGGVDGGGPDAGGALFLASRALPPAIELRPWSERFVPVGGRPPYAFGLDGGPPGFTLAVDGTLSTAAAPSPGSFGFSISVQDDGAPRAQTSAAFTLEVRPLLRVASQGAQPEGRQGQPYLHALSATGGAAPYQWSLDAGALPPGLSLSSDGLISGTPGSASARTFEVRVVDAASPPQSATRSLSLEVKALSTVLAIATTTAADGRVGTPYSQELRAFGGTQPYQWSVSSGALPPGVTLADTGTVGRLAGTPSMRGTFNVVLRCADTLTSQTQALSLTVH